MAQDYYSGTPPPMMNQGDMKKWLTGEDIPGLGKFKIKPQSTEDVSSNANINRWIRYIQERIMNEK